MRAEQVLGAAAETGRRGYRAPGESRGVGQEALGGRGEAGAGKCSCPVS